MTTLPVKEEKDPGVQMLARIAGSLALWFASFTAANWILAGDPPSPRVRAAAVALALCGFLPWVWIASRAIVAEDEFTRRVHFIALSWAFAATGIFVIGADLLVRAHFVDYVPTMHIWLFMIVAWWVSIMLTGRYYR